MMDRIEEQVMKIEYGLPEKIRQIQLQNIPTLIDIGLIEKSYYRYEGSNHTSDKRIFLASNLPIKSTIYNKPIFDKPLKSVVDENLIHPFILFINNRAVKWSNINLIIDARNSYLLISNIDKVEIKSIKAIRIPYRVRYGEDNIINANYNANFYFDSNGLLTMNAIDIAMRVEIITSSLICSNISSYNGYLDVPTGSYDRPATTDNIFVFNNGELIPSEGNIISKSYNIFTHNISNPGNLKFKTFYYIYGNNAIDNLYKLDSSIIKNNVINNINKPYMNKLKEGLNMNYSINDLSNLISTSYMEEIQIINLSDTKFIIAYRDKSNKNKGTVFIVEYIDDILYIGPNYIFNNTETMSIKAITVNINKALIFFADASNNLIGKVVLLSITDKNIVFEKYLTFTNSMVINLSIVKIDKNKYVICYSDMSNSDYGTSQLITLSNDYLNIKASNKYVFAPEDIYGISAIKTKDGSICVCYNDSNGYGAINIITVDNLGIIIGNKYIFESAVVSNININNVQENEFCLSYIHGATRNAIAQVLSVDGNSISILSKNTFDSGIVLYLRASSIDPNNIAVCLATSYSNIIFGIININNDKFSYDYDRRVINAKISEIQLLYIYDEICIIYTDANKNYNGYIYITHNSFNKLYKKMKNIMTYNPELLEEVYDELTPFESSIYTGSEINSKKDTNGYIALPRRRYNNLFGYVLIFVDGELYEDYNTISYINDKFKLFIGDNITDSSIIEIIFIKKVNNSIGNISINKNTPIKSNINEDDFNLFSTEVESRIYSIEDHSKVVYNVPFTNSNNIITLENDFYYNKDLSVVSSNLFKYGRYVVDMERVDIELGSEFKYCIDQYKYILFINGRFINSNNISVAIPNANNPFDEPVLYTNIILDPGNIVDVFYLPFETRDSCYREMINTNGDINIDESIPFGLDKDRYWYFVNGKKLSSINMNSINSNRLNIISDCKTRYNLLIERYMKPIDIISKLLSNENTWNKIISLIGSDITDFYNYTSLTNTEGNIKDDETDMKATILEAFAHYYAKYNTSSNPLLYDFNDILIDEKDIDSLGTYMVHLINGNLTNRVDVNR